MNSEAKKARAAVDWINVVIGCLSVALTGQVLGLMLGRFRWFDLLGPVGTTIGLFTAIQQIRMRGHEGLNHGN